MQPATVGVEESHDDLDGRDLCVEGLRIFEIVVPDLINNIAKIFLQRHVRPLCNWRSHRGGIYGPPLHEPG